MELHQLEHFVTIAEEESLSAAARRLHMAQSSVSVSLAALERALGVRLVERGRGRGRAELTCAGRIFLERAHTVLRAVRAAREAVRVEPGALHGTIRLATTMIPRDPETAVSIKQFLDDHPRVMLDVVHGPAPELISRLRQGEADIGLSPATDALPSSITSAPLLRTSVVVLCAPGHPVQGRTDLTADELRNAEFVDLGESWWLRHQFDSPFRRAGVERVVRIQLSQWHTALEAAQTTGRLTYGPLAAVEALGPPNPSGLQVVYLADAPTYEFDLLHSTEHPLNEPSRAMLDLLSAIARNRSSTQDASAALLP